jgi:hypothetical protein
MASPPIQPDMNAQLNSFLLREYITALHDPRRSPDEQLGQRMALEHLILTNGHGLLRELQRAFNIEDELLAASSHVAEWFVSFVSSLGRDWLQHVNLSTVERFWRVLADVRLRRSAIDLILKIEVANDPSPNAAPGSLVVSLFREAQPEPFRTPLAEAARIIVDTLFSRVRLTPVSIINSADGALSRYSVRVVRYCYKDQYQILTPEEMDAVVSLAGNVNEDLRQRIYSLML